MVEMQYDYPGPYSVRVTVKPGDIDMLGHANNVVYLRWLEQAAWSHSKALGVGWDVFRQLQRAMVAHRHELDYLAPCFEGDKLDVCTWVGARARVGFERHYQILRVRDGQTVMRALTRWVCVNLDTGRPAKMPAEFIAAYQPQG